MTLQGRLQEIVRPVAGPVRRRAIRWRTQSWPPFSRLFVAGDAGGWAIDDDADQIARVARQLGVQVGSERWVSSVRNQAVFYASQFSLIGGDFERDENRLGVTYLHGRPGQGRPEFDACYENVRARHEELSRVQVSCRAMEELVLGTGIAAEKVHRIPIGVDLPRFSLRDGASRLVARRALDLPESAFVVGSFQKDGVGWGDGLEPKLIKGPDVLLDALERLHRRVPELWVLLTGPARGYVKAGLERIGVPYRHVLLPDRDSVAEAYRALDVCFVASREEGGPKAVLEAMATGVPLVTTRVGQAADLARHGENAFVVELEDAEGLAEWGAHVAEAPEAELSALAGEERRTAEATSYDALRPRWLVLLRGFVAVGDG